jgi:predicted N-acyltransferase
MGAVGAAIDVLDGVASVSRDEWNALVAGASPFLEWEWLASLEEAGCVGAHTGWLPRPLVIREGGRLAAACPLYEKHHSEGEFVFDWGWADAAHRAGIDYYPKLLVGVPFTPVTGARFLTAPDTDRARAIGALGAGLRELCDRNGISGAHVNFCLPDERDALADAGYLLRVGIQYHWRNAGYATFDDYLGHLRSKRRNQVKRERRSVREQGIATEVLRGDDIPDAVFEPMFQCYRATVDAHFYGRRYLNRAFFELLRERFRRRLCFVIARRDGEIVAGTLNVVKGEALYGRYWGALAPIRHLHFDVCYYAAIEHCIEAGLARFEPGAGGDYKFLRGFDAQPTYSLHYLADRRLARAVERFLESERAQAAHAIEALQRQSQLKRAE